MTDESTTTDEPTTDDTNRFTVEISGPDPDCGWSDYKYSVVIWDAESRRTYAAGFYGRTATLWGAKRVARKYIKSATLNKTHIYDENTIKNA